MQVLSRVLIKEDNGLFLLNLLTWSEKSVVAI